jgi:phage gpG-like protein
MSDNFSVDVRINRDEVKKITGRIKNIIRPLALFAKKKSADIQKQFDNHTDPEGKPWAPLSPVTIARKKQNKDKILTHYGPLRKSVKVEVLQEGLRLTTGAPYAKFHQEGTSRMPQRKILAITEQDKVRLGRFIRQHVAGRR